LVKQIETTRKNRRTGKAKKHEPWWVEQRKRPASSWERDELAGAEQKTDVHGRDDQMDEYGELTSGARRSLPQPLLH